MKLRHPEKINNPISPIKKKLNWIRSRIVDTQNFYKTKAFIKKIKPDRIVHLAAYSNADRDKQIIKKSMEVNAIGLINLLKSIEKIKINSIVNVSTVDVYGNARPPFSETGMTNPISPYGIFKLSAENISNLYYHVYNLPVVNLRLSMVYGCLQPSNKIIPFIIESCIKRKNRTRTCNNIDRSVPSAAPLIPMGGITVHPKINT